MKAIHSKLALLLSLLSVLGMLLVVTGGSATAAPTTTGTADLSLRQTPSAGASNGTTTVKTVIHNAGPNTANLLNLTILIKTKSSMAFDVTSNLPTSCQQQPAPSGWAFLFNCQTSSVAAGSSWSLIGTYSGTAGVGFTNFESVGESDPGDPSLSNNHDTLKTSFAPAADLALTQVVTAGPSSGTVTITDTAKNVGISSANGLQLVIEINSPGLTSVGASTNLPGSCEFVAPASGFNAAASCTTSSSLGRLEKWVVQISYTGSPGGSLEQVGIVTANSPADPHAANNSATTNTQYAS
jgi:hypothetical protein